MAENTDHIRETIRFFTEKLAKHGTTAKGIDFNSIAAMHTRYEQVLRAIKVRHGFSLNDFGCGFGAIIDYMQDHGFSDFD